MTSSTSLRHTMLAVAFAVCGSLAPPAHALELLSLPLSAGESAAATKSAPGSQPQALTVDADESEDGSAAQAQGNVAELKQMVQSGQLVELRVTYNGSYGATLFFFPREMVYYVALFQEKRFWRVVKTQDENRADTVYAQFARKSYNLAEGEIRRTQLQAQKALLERVIAVSDDRARRLSADLAIARAQESQVSQRQQQTQAESAALQNEKLAAEQKLRALQQQVQQLQSQTEAGLPPGPPSR
ncbi:putative lipoprotein [Caballeronia glathei]|uniref:Signal peptide protein n=1 Tax=Caballeronia glathei TaxID=60547 RepID=A0A069PIG0_9BURK|nr:DUF2968 domain-containing protein [Caballeronia glathei]KDR40390.1 signal peptide protein [Caballeronia glathei]CDY75950.1 putative lipoprotein [Caballeronia glathei]